MKNDEARRCAKCGQPFGKLTTSLTTCESCFDEAQANADEARRRAEECVTEVLNRLDADGMNWGQTLDDGVRAVERLVADAVAQANEEIARDNMEIAQLREEIARLRAAIETHSCSHRAQWCADHKVFHVGPHGPAICEALRYEPTKAERVAQQQAEDAAFDEALRRESKKMLCSFCKTMVDPEGHRWECSGREPAGDAGTRENV